MAASSFEVAASICSTAWRHQFDLVTSFNNHQRDGSTEGWQRLLTSLRLFTAIKSATLLTVNCFKLRKTVPPASAEEMVPRRPAIKKHKFIYLITQSPLFGQNGQKQTNMHVYTHHRPQIETSKTIWKSNAQPYCTDTLTAIRLNYQHISTP